MPTHFVRCIWDRNGCLSIPNSRSCSEICEIWSAVWILTVRVFWRLCVRDWWSWRQTFSGQEQSKHCRKFRLRAWQVCTSPESPCVPTHMRKLVCWLLLSRDSRDWNTWFWTAAFDSGLPARISGLSCMIMKSANYSLTWRNWKMRRSNLKW